MATASAWHAARFAVALLAVLVSAAASAERARADARPPACAQRSDPGRSAPVQGRFAMVAAAHPAAAEAGCAVLARGGNAVDAAVAVQMVLAVVEPQSSGLGGGTVITHYDRSSGRVRFYDGLSRAPERVTDGLDTPTAEERAALEVDEFESEVGATGRAVGVPGTPRVLDLVHDDHGRLPWRRLFARAIDLAEDGFPMPPYLYDVMSESTEGLERCAYPDLGARYCDGGEPHAVGERVSNPELAAVLRELRAGGADAFYDAEGTIAPAIVERATAGPYKLTTDASGPAVIPSLLTTEDFETYEAKERSPVCRAVLRRVVCTSAPPAFGGVKLLYELGLMERGGIEQLAPGSRERVHLAIEASRLAGFDTRQYIGDPDFHPVPVGGLLADDYLDERFGLFSPDRAVHPIAPGQPSFEAASTSARPGEAEPEGAADATSHVSIIDRHGDAVAMTTTVNSNFGSQLVARGIVLNNVQTNFTGLGSISPGEPVNVMEPRKRPRTSIAPTLAFDDAGRLRLVVGAAGGGAIPDYVAQTFLGVTVDELDPQRAINQGHWNGQEITGNCAGIIGVRSELEAGTEAAALLSDLQALAHPCPRVTELRSGLTAIERRRDGGLLGAADRRRDGVAVGG